MMLQALGSSAKRVVNRAKLTKGVGDTSGTDVIEAAEDTSLRLEKELAVLLARKPKHRNVPAALKREAHDDEAPLLLDDNEIGDEAETSTGFEEAPKFTDGTSGLTPEAKPEVSSKPAETGESDTCKQWMQSTRRSRRSNLFRKTASFAITFAVTAFIISVVAIILFGLPNGMKNLASSHNRTAAISNADNRTIAAEVAPTRLRWVSN